MVKPFASSKVMYASSTGLWHASPMTCSALVDTRERAGSNAEFRTHVLPSYRTTRIPSGNDAAFAELGRVCRHCAQVPVAAHLLSRSATSPQWATFMLLDPRYERTCLSPDANARSLELAKAVPGLLSFPSARGTVLAARASAAALSFLAANAHVFTLPTRPQAMPALATAWALNATPGFEDFHLALQAGHLVNDPVPV